MTIKEARQFAGLTQKEVEELTGIPWRSIQNWEMGVRTPPAYVEEYLIQKLRHERMIVRVKVTVSEINVEMMTENGFEVHTSAPIKNGLIPLSILISIGQLSEAGYKIIYM